MVNISFIGEEEVAVTKYEAIDILKNEIACVKGNDGKCDRDCFHCDLVLPEEEILEAYDMAINALEDIEPDHCEDCQEFDCWMCQYKAK